MKFLMTSAAIAALAAMPATAQAQFFGGFDNSSVLGGLAGAGIGGAIGSNIAGSGNRDEGTAIGAALGGLAGVGYGNSRSRYGANPFAGSFNPGFTGNSLIGTGIGAGIGGAIGSNLAGSGVRQEGTAIGAVLGGLAGYGLSNRGGQQNFNGGGFAPAGFNGGGFAPAGFNGGYAPAGFNGGYAPAGFNGGYGAPSFGNAGIIGGGLGLPARGNGTSFVPSGQYIAGPVIPVTRYVQPAPRPVIVSQPRTVYSAPAITVAAPTVRLAPAPIRQRIVRRTHRVEHMPIARAERIIVPAPVYADCPSGTTQQSDGSCLERTVSYSAPAPAPVYTPAPAPVVSQPYVVPAAPTYADCPSGTTQQSDGTCLERQTYSAPAPVYTAPAPVAQCPSGTTKQSDGTCLSPSITHSASSYVAPAPAPVYTAPAPVYTAPVQSYTAPAPAVIQYEQAPARSSSQEYCYSDSSKRYDSLGREIMVGGSDCKN